MLQYHPLLKKRDEEFPVSDLKFVSKLIEKAVVAWQLNDHILDRDVDKNNSGIFFSTWSICRLWYSRPWHPIVKRVYSFVSERNCAVLAKVIFNIARTFLQCENNSRPSQHLLLERGVPQESVLGPLLYLHVLLYSSPRRWRCKERKILLSKKLTQSNLVVGWAQN